MNRPARFAFTFAGTLAVIGMACRYFAEGNTGLALLCAGAVAVAHALLEDQFRRMAGFVDEYRAIAERALRVKAGDSE